jgi:hypothetical protein
VAAGAALARGAGSGGALGAVPLAGAVGTALAVELTAALAQGALLGTVTGDALARRAAVDTGLGALALGTVDRLLDDAKRLVAVRACVFRTIKRTTARIRIGAVRYRIRST